MRIVNESIISAVTNASFNGAAIPARDIYAGSFMAIFSDAAAAGTMKVQYSNDPAAGKLIPNAVPVNWVDVPSASVVVAAGATSSIPMPQMFAFQWLRLVWTRTAGAGTITVNCNLQGN